MESPCRSVLALVSFFVVLAAAGATPLSKGPYLQAPGPDTMTVMWETRANEPGTLRFGEGEKLDRTLAPVAPTAVQSATVAGGTTTFYVYQARLTALKPNTTYSYEVSVGGERSRSRKFRTFGSAPATVTFIAYGDSRTNPDKHAAIASQFPRFAPDFILHTGDLVAKGSQYELWDREYFDPLQNVIDRAPLLPAIGNHEQDGANYSTYFPQAGTKSCFFSFDVGPVHVLTLDYRSTKTTDEQFRFVEADLKASRAPWKIALLHYPVFNLGGHATLWGHESYLPLFRAMQVDLVITGHSHLYERFRPLAPRAPSGAWPIQHLTTGGGGAPLAAVVADPSLAAAFSTHHFVVFTATRDRLDGKCIDIDGREIDAFTLRQGAKPEPREIYAEEDVIAANQKLPRPKKKEAPAAKTAATIARE